MRTSRSLTSVSVKVVVAGVLTAVGLLAAAAPSSAADQASAAPSAAVDDRREAERDGDTMQVQYTTGFQVNNTSSTYVLSLNRVTGDGNFEGGRPELASWVRPGDFHRYELTSYLFKQENDVAVYDVLKLDTDGNGTRVGDLTVTMRESRIYNRTNFMSASTRVPGLSITASGQRDDSVQPYVTVSDSDARVVTLGSDQPEAQGAAIALMGRPLVTSSYTPTKQFSTIGKPYPVGGPVTNTRSYAVSTTVGGSETHGVDTSFTLGSEVSLELGPITGTISATWGKTVSTSTTVSQEITTEVPAYSTVWLEAESPVTRVTGDFTIKLGETTYFLKDTTLDFPQKGGTPHFTVRGVDAAGHVATLRTF